jgi:hypothetical protein
MNWSEADLQIHQANQRIQMRRAAKVDRTHAEIVKVFRQMGASVQDLSAVGKGCPDLLIGFRGVNVLAEIKDGELTEGHRQLTSDQKVWHGSWAGQVAVVKSVGEAAELVARIGCGKV